MSHNYETQRRDTYASFKNTQGVKLPKEAVVEFLFFIEELDANWKALEKALQAAGFRTRRLEDGVSLVASFGPMPVTPEAIWQQEREATSIALKHDFYPDGWELAE
ncbi:MAG: ribonuclease E inhibitor RraB [Pseudomonadota bacterium]